MASLVFFISAPPAPDDDFSAFEAIFTGVGLVGHSSGTAPSVAAIIATIAATLLLVPIIYAILRRAY